MPTLQQLSVFAKYLHSGSNDRNQFSASCPSQPYKPLDSGYLLSAKKLQVSSWMGFS